MNASSRSAAGAVMTGLVLAIANSALAQQPTAAQQSAIRSACRSDFQAVCTGVEPGGSAALQCLKQNAVKVSAPCQQALAPVGGGDAAAPAAAGASAAPQGGGMQGGGMQGGGMQGGGMQGGGMQGGTQGRMQGGMGGMSMRDELVLTREACGQDYRTYCQRVQPGGGRAITCLEANAASLAPACQQALMAMKQRMGK